VQFATPDAVTRLREIRRSPRRSTLVAISAADPLNLAGIVVAGERIASLPTTKIACVDGTPVAVLEGDFLRPLVDYDPALSLEITRLLSGRALPAVVRGFVGRAG
jgi:ATP-dependent Lhr-like helicase